MAAATVSTSTLLSFPSTNPPTQFPKSWWSAQVLAYSASSLVGFSWRERKSGVNLRKAQLPRQIHVCRAEYRVTLISPRGEATSLSVADDVYILDAAEDSGMSLPYSCRSGACSSCAAVLKAGKVDQSNQTYLTDAQEKAGYVLTCVAYPLSDIIIETHRESGLY